MSLTSTRYAWLGIALSFAATPAAFANDLVPYSAGYVFSLVSAKPGSNIVGARGAMLDEWGETCDGWTEHQRMRLTIQRSEDKDTEIGTDLATWEAKDGLKFRFLQRQSGTGDADDAESKGGADAKTEVKGEAILEGDDKGGTAVFEQPQSRTLTLAPGTVFPAFHTALLIDRARAGDSIVTRNAFDGSDVIPGQQITALIGPQLPSGSLAAKEATLDGDLLNRPSWPIHLSFFSGSSGDLQPDFEELIHLLDNGIAKDMEFNYGDFSVRATLQRIEAAPRPKC